MKSLLQTPSEVIIVWERGLANGSSNRCRLPALGFALESPTTTKHAPLGFSAKIEYCVVHPVWRTSSPMAKILSIVSSISPPNTICSRKNLVRTANISFRNDGMPSVVVVLQTTHVRHTKSQSNRARTQYQHISSHSHSQSWMIKSLERMSRKGPTISPKPRVLRAEHNQVLQKSRTSLL